MNTKYHDHAGYSISSTEKLIYIVGPTRIQNSLIASFLEQSTATKCELLASLNRIPRRSTGNGSRTKLIIWDCLGKDGDSCLLEYEANADRVSSKDKVAFFNISPALGIEEKAIARGVEGFFYEQDPLELFAKGVRAIFDGELWVNRKIMANYIRKSTSQTFAPPDNKTTLTTREVEILRLLATGATNSKVADSLCISPHTVRTHLHNTFKKIKVRNRLQAALWSAKNL
jgi:LuxR family transcriptional regulator of csgAB operon